MNIDLEPYIKAAESAIHENPGDYYFDGLLYCGNCHTEKEFRIQDIHGNNCRIVKCLCRCETERRDQEDQERKAQKRALYINQLRVNGIQDRTVRAYTFNGADDTPILEKCRRYVENWSKMYQENVGLIIWGNTGNGKTFAAACIANALLDQGIPVMFTSIPRLLSSMTGLYSSDRTAYFDSLSNFKLLVIDDLGAERQNEFAIEQVYSVVDTRYKNGQPLIVTTNMTLDEMRNPKNMDYQRIYDRILEMCMPIHFAGDSLRKAKASQKLDLARELLK